MDGILIINKEAGYTSRDVVNILVKKLGTKKIGHTGTLDPIATGVLVVCIGKYTKLVNRLTCEDKEYIAMVKLGIRTDTLDVTGNILEENDINSVDNQVLINTLESFLGKSLQEVPKYSAIKVNGKKLYEYARNGEEVVLPTREIEVKEIELIENKEGFFTFRVVVSKGTYIRSLIRDICKKMNCLGSMESLIRTRQGKFTIAQAVLVQNDCLLDNLLTVEDIFDYPIYELNEDEYFKVKNGASLKIDRNDTFLIMKYQEKVVAIYQYCDDSYRIDIML